MAGNELGVHRWEGAVKGPRRWAGKAAAFAEEEKMTGFPPSLRARCHGLPADDDACVIAVRHSKHGAAVEQCAIDASHETEVGTTSDEWRKFGGTGTTQHRLCSAITVRRDPFLFLGDALEQYDFGANPVSISVRAPGM